MNMENHIYRITGSDDAILDFKVSSTNELKPYRETRELDICFKKGKEFQFFPFNEAQLSSLIDYLTAVQKYNKEFNDNSKPKVSNEDLNLK